MTARRVTSDEARVLLAKKPRRSKHNVNISKAGKDERTMGGITFAARARKQEGV
jgi:hypothetical protein